MEYRKLMGAGLQVPVAGGSLSGKIRRNHAPPEGSRAAQMDFVVSAKSETLLSIVDVLAAISSETGKTIAQVALNWVLNRPSVASLVIGARNEEQLIQNFGAVGWKLTEDQVARLEVAQEKSCPGYFLMNQRLHR